jgi:hypothetical protein
MWFWRAPHAQLRIAHNRPKIENERNNVIAKQHLEPFTFLLPYFNNNLNLLVSNPQPTPSSVQPYPPTKSTLF